MLFSLPVIGRPFVNCYWISDRRPYLRVRNIGPEISNHESDTLRRVEDSPNLIVPSMFSQNRKCMRANRGRLNATTATRTSRRKLPSVVRCPRGSVIFRRFLDTVEKTKTVYLLMCFSFGSEYARIRPVRNNRRYRRGRRRDALADTTAGHRSCRVTPHNVPPVHTIITRRT